jgi:hypothetical protein
MTSSNCIILFVLACLGLALSAANAAARTSLSPPYASYAVKFPCGTATADADVVKCRHDTCRLRPRILRCGFGFATGLTIATTPAARAVVLLFSPQPTAYGE